MNGLDCAEIAKSIFILLAVFLFIVMWMGFMLSSALDKIIFRLEKIRKILEERNKNIGS